MNGEPGKFYYLDWGKDWSETLATQGEPLATQENVIIFNMVFDILMLNV